MSARDRWTPESTLMTPAQQYLNLRFKELVTPESGVVLTSVADITASGGRVTTGPWARPDLTFVQVWRPRYAGERQVRVYTFAVKTADGGDVAGVHEALAHSQYGHQAFLLWHLPDRAQAGERLRQVRAACVRQGVGLITVGDPDDVDQFVVETASVERTPRLDVVDQFLEDRLSDTAKQLIRQALEG